MQSFCLILLLLLYSSSVVLSTTNVLLENTGLQCTKQSDCITLLGSGSSWCKYSTILCLAHQCRVSPLRACLPYESGKNISSPCLKRNHRCEVKPCNSDSDCGDEDGNRQFCDGYDKCTNNLCQFYFLTNNCARQNTKCIKLENICSPPFRAIITDSPTTTSGGGVITIHIVNSTNSTNTTTESPPQTVNFWLWWIILFGIFGGVTLFVVIVATLTRNAPPTFVPNNRGDGVAYYY